MDMSPAAVKKLIKKSGATLRDLSTKNGFSESAVSIALRRKSPFVQQVIAEHLGMKPQTIWPSRYDANGSPLRLDARGRAFIGSRMDTTVKAKAVAK